MVLSIPIHGSVMRPAANVQIFACYLIEVNWVNLYVKCNLAETRRCRRL